MNANRNVSREARTNVMLNQGQIDKEFKVQDGNEDPKNEKNVWLTD